MKSTKSPISLVGKSGSASISASLTSTSMMGSRSPKNASYETHVVGGTLNLIRSLFPESFCQCGTLFTKPQMLMPCGHTVCENCAKTLDTCPVCGTEIQTSVTNTVLEEMIMAPVPCLFRAKNEGGLGCRWKGPLSELQKHLDGECQWAIVSCPFENFGCRSTCRRRQLTEHVTVCEFKVVQCPECGEEVCSKNMDRHKSVCPAALTRCPRCKEKVKKCDLEDHLRTVCQMIESSCPMPCCRGVKITGPVKAHLAGEGEILVKHQNWAVKDTERVLSTQSEQLNRLASLRQCVAARKTYLASLDLMASRIRSALELYRSAIPSPSCSLPKATQLENQNNTKETTKNDSQEKEPKEETLTEHTAVDSEALLERYSRLRTKAKNALAEREQLIVELRIKCELELEEEGPLAMDLTH